MGYSPLDDIAERVRLATRSSDAADTPGVALAAAQTTNPVATAQAASAFRWGVETAGTLRSLGEGEQRTVWGRMTEPEQQTLKMIGYLPPEDKGFFHTLSETLRRPWTLITEPLKPGLHVAGAPIRFIQHSYRTAHEVGPEGGHGFIGSWAPSDWAAAWRKTKDGERYMPRAERALVASGLPDQYHDIAIGLAGGDTLEFLIGKYGPELVASATNHPAWDKAQDFLGRSKGSFGRVFARAVGVESGAGNTLLSGSLDGVFDWFGDPLNVPAAKIGELRALRYQVAGPEDVARAWDYASVALARNRILGHLNSESGVAGAIDEFRELQPIAKKLVGVTTDDELRLVMEDAASLKSALDGKGAGFLQNIPHTGPATLLARGVKRGVGTALDKGTSVGIDVTSSISGEAFASAPAVPSGTWRSMRAAPARLLKGLSTQYRKARVLDLADEGSVPFIEQVAKLTIPKRFRAEYVNAYIAGDLAQRHAIYESLINDTFHGLGSKWEPGVSASNALEEYHRSFMGTVGETFERPYGIDSAGNINSLVDTPAGPRSFGISEEQFTSIRGLPDIETLARVAKEDRLLPSIDYEPVLKATKVWKQNTLLRAGFPVRVGGDEAFLFVNRKGLLPYLRGKLSTITVKEGDELGPVRRWLAGRTAYAAKAANVAVGDKWYALAADVQLRQHGARLLPDHITSGSDWATTEESLIKAVRTGRKGRLVELRMKAEEWETSGASGLVGAEKWQMGLKSKIDNPSFQKALEHAHGGPGAFEDAVDSVAELMASPEWAKHAGRSAMLRELEESGLSREEAIRDLARRNVETTWALTHDRNGVPYDFVDQLRGKDIPGADELNTIAQDARPHMLASRRMVPVPATKYQRFSNWAFRHFDDVIDGIAREPIYNHELASALKAVAPQVRKAAAVVGDEAAQDLGAAWATQRAFNNVRPYIHDPELRSVFEQYHQPLLPFWFAKEQFYRRWARALKENPVAFRKAQLIASGLRHSGFLHRDEEGNDFFVMPTLPYQHTILGAGIKAVTGKDAFFPIDVPMTGHVKFLNAASEGPAPGFGPFVGASLGVIRKRFPVLFGVDSERVEEGLLGERGAGRPLWQHFTPTVVNNAYAAILGKPEDVAQVASAINGAILQLHAAGLDPAPDATPEERAKFLQRVTVWARGLLVLRAAYGFVAPAAPNLQFPAKELNPELHGLMRALPFETAIAEFMRRHPDDAYLTVFSTTSAPGGHRPVPVTKVAGDWIAEHRSFIDAYGPAAASFFVPDAPTGFDQATWKEELSIGLRVRKSPEDYWRDLQLAGDKDFYYSNQDRYFALRSQTPVGSRGALDQQWGEWKRTYIGTRPLLADWLERGGDRAQNRSKTIASLLRAVDAGHIPDADSRLLLEGYRSYFAQRQSLTGRNDATSNEARRQLVRNFSDWAGQFASPIASSIFIQLISPDLPRYEDDNG